MTTYCNAFWALYNALDKMCEKKKIDDYRVAYRLKEHRMKCKRCSPMKVENGVNNESH